MDCCPDSDAALSAAEAAAVASSTAAAAAAAAGGAVDYLYSWETTRSIDGSTGCVSLVQDHARECGLSYEASAAGFRYTQYYFAICFEKLSQGGLSIAQITFYILHISEQ